MLADFDPNQIQDVEGARQAIIRILNLVEELSSENQLLREEVQRLRDENNRLKGEQGRPPVKANQGKQKSSAISVLESSHNIWRRFGPLEHYIQWSMAISAERVYFPLIPSLLRSRGIKAIITNPKRLPHRP